MSAEQNPGLNGKEEQPDSPEIDNGRIQYGQPETDWLQEGPFAGRGPQGSQRSDERICADICQGLEWHGAIDASAVEVSVAGGEATLAGTVASREACMLAENIARAVSGVYEVHNRLRIQPAEEAEGSDER